MNMGTLATGLLIGFSVAAPVGPIGVLCIRRTLAGGRALGFVSGAGAATADALFGCVAAFGLTFISSLLISQQDWIRLFGGLFLCYLGVQTLRSRPSDQPAQAESQGLAGAYLSTVFLTLTNPATILSFVAIFAGVGIAQGETSYARAALLLVGLFIGSLLWWLLLSTGVSLFRSRMNATALLWINRLSGAIILAFGVAALGSLLRLWM